MESPGPTSSSASSPPATPLWVKVLGIAVLVTILGFVVFHFLGNAPTGH